MVPKQEIWEVQATSHSRAFSLISAAPGQSPMTPEHCAPHSAGLLPSSQSPLAFHFHNFTKDLGTIWRCHLLHHTVSDTWVAAPCSSASPTVGRLGSDVQCPRCWLLPGRQAAGPPPCLLRSSSCDERSLPLVIAECGEARRPWGAL